jgi:hypothetical protein
MPDGRYSFKAIGRLAKQDPVLVRGALVVAPSQLSQWSRVGMYPLHYAQIGFAAIRVGLQDRTLRRLLREARSLRLAWDRMLEDVLKLWLLRRHSGFAISSVIDGRTLRIVSVERGEPAVRVDRDQVRHLFLMPDFDGIDWDHSKIGQSVTMKSLGIAMLVHLPNKGLHRFHTLREIARVNPEAIVDALRPALVEPALSLIPTSPSIISTGASVDELTPANVRIN